MGGVVFGREGRRGEDCGVRLSSGIFANNGPGRQAWTQPNRVGSEISLFLGREKTTSATRFKRTEEISMAVQEQS